MLNELLLRPAASIIFAFTLITSIYTFLNSSLIHTFSLHPYSIARKRKLYTIFTSGLIHANLPHLAFNMLSYFFFAFTLEDMVGHWQFAVIYLSGLILSDLSTIYKHRNHPSYYSLGASGAISAVLFSYILFDPFSKIYLFPIPFGIPAFLFAVLYLVYCMYAARKQEDMVNHEAHFWGAVTGLIVTIALFPDVLSVFIERFTL